MNLNDPTLLRQLCYLDGAWVPADDGRTMAVRNPATGEHLADVPVMGAGETRRAIVAAHAAQSHWRERTGKQRAAVLRKWADLMLAHVEDLALIMTSEQGKPMAESRAEIGYAASFLEWFGEEAKRVYGDTIPGFAPDRRIVVIKQPVGVAAAITPWNFPSAMITRKAGPAIAVGCTIVVKPAPQTPLSAFALAELAERAGVPAGVFSVLTGDAETIGGEITANPLVRKLSFTGSTATGRKLIAQSAGTVKKISMELGGNAPFLVFDDADLDAAVEGAIASKFRNAGQTCVCANRILVHDSVYEAFAEKLGLAVCGLKVGNGVEEHVTQGPLIDERALAKVERHIEDALAKGARVVTGGKRHKLGGCYFEPTILADVSPDMLVAREETFGPVAPLFRFRTDDEAVLLSNDTEFGLAGYFYSRDVNRIWRMAEAMECGMIGINTGLISSEVAPFGGVKESGFGREGSKYGIDEYLEMKYLCFGGVAP
jgi:succinate-semialdehyde dehydrogenase/glutarate-semialdehyde dehydrogenase